MDRNTFDGTAKISYRFPFSIDASTVCEYLAFWLGGTDSREVGRVLGYTSRQVSTLIQGGFDRWDRPTARYDASRKGWLPCAPPDSLHGPKTAHDAVVVLQALRFWSEGTDLEAMFPVVNTASYRRNPAADTFRTLLGGCARKQVVDVVYQARTREHAVSFSPHTLVVTAHRMHFRGYSVFEDAARNEYWDLVPSRVLSAELRPAFGYVGMANDAHWHKEDMLRLALRPGLKDAMRQAIRHEHGMLTDTLEIGPVRKALLRYVRDEHLGRPYVGHVGPIWDVVE